PAPAGGCIAGRCSLLFSSSIPPRLSECAPAWRAERATMRACNNRALFGGDFRNARGIIGENRRQPFLGLLDAPALPLCIILDLVAVDAADAEIRALGMRKIETRHGRARPHCVALGEFDPDLRLCVEQFE